MHSYEGQAAGAIRMLASEVDQRLTVIPQGRTIITYCACPTKKRVPKWLWNLCGAVFSMSIL